MDLNHRLLHYQCSTLTRLSYRTVFLFAIYYKKCSLLQTKCCGSGRSRTYISLVNSQPFYPLWHYQPIWCARAGCMIAHPMHFIYPCLLLWHNRPECLWLTTTLHCLRRVWDSNPREFPNGFADRPFQPLRQPFRNSSMSKNAIIGF